MIIAFLVAILILLITQIVRAEPTTRMARSASSPAATQVDKQNAYLNVAAHLTRVEKSLRDFKAVLIQTASRANMVKAKESVQRNERQLADIPPALDVGPGEVRQNPILQNAKIEGQIDALRVVLNKHADEQQDSLYQFQRHYFWNLEQLVLCVCLVLVLFAIGRVLMERRIQDIEQMTLTSLSTDAPKLVNTNSKIAKLLGKNEVTLLTKRTLPRGPIRPAIEVIPNPADQIAMIIRQAARSGHLRVKPEAASVIWTLGLATSQGNVRSENQDYCLGFRIRGRDVLIIADGLGGVPHGRKAAHSAVVNSAISVIRAFGIPPRWCRPSAKDVAARAIVDAAHRLAVDGDKLNISVIRDGLRTTLIVIIADQREVTYAYIGDGGGFIVRTSGEVHQFLKPQKATDFANVLAASLGPIMEGEPVVGALPRRPGDFLVAGTDGVFDRVADGFAKDVLRGAIENDGDLQRTAEQVINELASYKDGTGYVCDDNLTLGLMCDGIPPKLTQGFWKSVEAIDGKSVSDDLFSASTDLKERTQWQATEKS